MATTLADVAAHAGVSVQTVSNAVNNPALLKATTLERVRASIDALGYRPNLQARRLRQRHAATIGLRIAPVADNIASSLLDRFLHELTAQAGQRGITVMLFTADDDAAEIDEIRGLADQGLADRFLLTNTHESDERIGALVDAGTRFVAFGRPWGEAAPHAWVDVDGATGTREATDALLDAGHRRIAFVGWPEGSGSGDDRRRGWVEAMQAQLGSSDAELDALTARSPESVRDAIAAAAPLVERVDAVVCASDSLAAGTISAALQAGVTLPVVGFDDTSFARGIGFPSIDQRLDLVAAAALDALDGGAPTQTLVTPRLVRHDDPRWGLASTGTRGSAPL